MNFKKRQYELNSQIISTSWRLFYMILISVMRALPLQPDDLSNVPFWGETETVKL